MEQSVRWDRLQKWLAHIPTIPQSSFTMHVYRSDSKDRYNPVCGTVGCILGHMTALAEEPLPLNDVGIDFMRYSETELGFCVSSRLWKYLFSADWGDFHPFIYQAEARIAYALQNSKNHEDPNDVFWSDSFKYHQFKDLSIDLINDPANNGMRPG